MYARLQIVIQLPPTLTKLCHTATSCPICAMDYHYVEIFFKALTCPVMF